MGELPKGAKMNHLALPWGSQLGKELSSDDNSRPAYGRGFRGEKVIDPRLGGDLFSGGH